MTELSEGPCWHISGAETDRKAAGRRRTNNSFVPPALTDLPDEKPSISEEFTENVKESGSSQSFGLRELNFVPFYQIYAKGKFSSDILFIFST